MKYKPTEIQIQYNYNKFNRICFSNVYRNKTVLDTEGVNLDPYTYHNRISQGVDAGYYEAPWAVFLRLTRVLPNGSMEG